MSGLAVLCPGQGAQHAAMLELAAGSARGREVVREASDALGEDLLQAVAADGRSLFENARAQPLLCAAELATWAALRDAVGSPLVFAGYSLGELAAHGCAGALGVTDTVALAVRRAALMDAATAEAAAGAPDGGEPDGAGSGLVGVRGVRVGRVEALATASGAEVAIVNGPDHCIVGGSGRALRAFERQAIAAGATKVERLPVSVAAHTSALAAAVAPFALALEQSRLRDPAVPVLAGIIASPVRRRADAIGTLSRQLAERIEWARCVATAAELGCTVFLELGPGTALAKMATELVPHAAARSVADFRSLDGVARWVARALATG